MPGSGRPAGAARRGPRPIVAVGTSVTGRSSPTGFTRDWPSLPQGACRSSAVATAPDPPDANEPSPSRYRIPTATASCCRVPGIAPGDGLRSAARQSVDTDTSKMPTDGPRTDPGRTDHRPRATGRDLPHDRSLPGSDVTGGRPRTRLEDPSCGHRARARVDVQCRDRGRRSGVVRLGRRRDDPEPPTSGRRLRADQARPGTSSTPSTSAPTRSTTRRSIYGAINGMTEAVGDTGHTSFMTPEQRAAALERPVGQVRRDRRPHRRRRRRPAARSSGCSRTARPRRPASRPATRSSRSTASRPAVTTSTRSPAGSAAKPGTTRRRHGQAGATGTPRDVTMVRADVATTPVSWTLVPGHPDRAHPPRPVLGRRRRRPQGAPSARPRRPAPTG